MMKLKDLFQGLILLAQSMDTDAKVKESTNCQLCWVEDSRWNYSKVSLRLLVQNISMTITLMTTAPVTRTGKDHECITPNHLHHYVIGIQLCTFEIWSCYFHDEYGFDEIPVIQIYPHIVLFPMPMVHAFPPSQPSQHRQVVQDKTDLQ